MFSKHSLIFPFFHYYALHKKFLKSSCTSSYHKHSLKQEKHKTCHSDCVILTITNILSNKKSIKHVIAIASFSQSQTNNYLTNLPLIRSLVPMTEYFFLCLSFPEEPLKRVKIRRATCQNLAVVRIDLLRVFTFF